MNEFTLFRESKHWRNFYINKIYAGCTGDSGWLVVKDANLSNPCAWEKQTTYPQFLYSQQRQVSKWNDMSMKLLFKNNFSQHLFKHIDVNKWRSAHWYKISSLLIVSHIHLFYNVVWCFIIPITVLGWFSIFIIKVFWFIEISPQGNPDRTLQCVLVLLNCIKEQ